MPIAPGQVVNGQDFCARRERYPKGKHSEQKHPVGETWLGTAVELVRLAVAGPARARAAGPMACPRGRS